MVKVLAKPKTEYRGGLAITKHDVARLLLGVFGFFIGRVIVFDFVNPVAPAFLACFLGTTTQFNVLLLLIGAGLASRLSGVYLAKYAVCFGLAFSANFLLIHWRKKQNLFASAAIIGGITLFSGLFLAVMNSVNLYFITIAFFEAVISMCLTIIIKKGSLIAFGTRKRKILSNEEIISLAVLFGAVIAGSADIYIGDVSLKIFFCSFVILIASYKGGSAFGCTVGMLLGLILYAAGLAYAGTCIVFAIAGLCASVFKFKDKLGAITGFALGGAVACLYFGRDLLGMELLLSVASGCILFALMPDNFYFNINTGINPALDNSDEYIDRIKEITSTKLSGVSAAIYKLSKAFGTLAQKKNGLNQNDVVGLIDDIAVRACGNCSMKDFCWTRNFYDTYQTVFGILSACEKTDSIAICDLPRSFRENCINSKKFVEITNRLFEIYKVNVNWQNKIAESRDLVSEQLAGVSKIIGGLAAELDLNLNFNSELEETIIAELNQRKIEVSSVIVLENKKGKYEITIEHKPCYGKRSCNKIFAPVIGQILNRKMRNETDDCVYKRDICRTRLVEEQKYKITSGVARLAKNRNPISGDSYTFMELKNGQCLLALSDGMGSGRRAHEESATAIELLEDFIESGFDKEIAVKMINSVLVLKSGEESFSTLDICSVDLYTGNAEFIKIGAAQTYILRDRTVYTVKSSSLPIGILDTVDLEISAKKLKDNDMIIMLTDGISEIEGDSGRGEWISSALSRIESKNPQDIADYIMQAAQELTGDETKDDMTVLVSRIWEKL